MNDHQQQVDMMSELMNSDLSRDAIERRIDACQKKIRSYNTQLSLTCSARTRGELRTLVSGLRARCSALTKMLKAAE